MCGIALVLSGDHRVVAPSAVASEFRLSDEGKVVSVDELKEALRRRGPDSLGCERLRLCSDGTILGGDGCDGDEASAGAVELYFIGATLQLRGSEPVLQPLVAQSGNVLVYNGEIYGGIHVADDQNDTQSLLSSLESSCCCDCHVLDRGEACLCCGCVGKSVPHILSTVKGPWALIYWQADKLKNYLVRSGCIWKKKPLVSTVNGLAPGADPDFSDYTNVSYWEELPCGIYSIQLKHLEKSGMLRKEECCVEVRKHDWMDSSLHKLIRWERKSIVPSVEDLTQPSNFVDKGNHHLYQSFRNSKEGDENTGNGVIVRDLPSDISLSPANCMTQPAYRVLIALHESVMLRTNVNRLFQGDLNKHTDEELAPIAILFSGGLDSMILAALLDRCLDSKWMIDLLNVSFDGQLAPDRVSALAGLKELQRVCPLRRWRLVEIDTALTNLKWESEHVMSLIHPSSTYMDLNIGIALWLAAGGDGWVDGSMCNRQGGHRCKYKSMSRVLLVGSGADEQCAGYGRHRTKYRLGGWVSLDEEMRLDVQRIWKRNMGRDDRCISDHGKEARFPFLDENVIKTLLEIPLWEIAKLDEPVGKGDKKILREVANLLGLQEAALQPKRAIQFGSRIARESNRRNFGSNRAANQASAGSLEIQQHTHRHLSHRPKES